MTDLPQLPFLPDRVRDFLGGTRYATISTVDPDGWPRPAVVWYAADGDEIVINSALGRRWPTNLLRDPRLSFAVFDRADAYRWVGLTGTVRAISDHDTTQADSAAMARRYHADDPAKIEWFIKGHFEREDRVTFRFRAKSILDNLDPYSWNASAK